MLKYRGAKLVRSGVIGVILMVLIISVGLQPDRIARWATAIRYQALFTEAGGAAAARLAVARDPPRLVVQDAANPDVRGHRNR